tara:strand:+ start:645 stop:1337 length:693 start_codon:yes stop_codon:yes gene_type:complete
MITKSSNKIIKDNFDHWVFDLDNTLYDIKLGLFKKISERITTYIVNYLKLPELEAKILQREMYLKYGLTLRGLIVEKNIDPDSFLNYVHDVSHPELKKDNELKGLLKNLPGNKYVYTNASYKHAENILLNLGIYDLFKKIIDIKDTNYIPKPDPRSYEIMKKKFDLNELNINRSILIEDTISNLIPAKNLGMTTVWIENKLNYPNFKKNIKIVDYSFKNVKSFLRFIKND